MTDVLIDSMSYTVETQDVDWWGDYDEEPAVLGATAEPSGPKPEKAKLCWQGVQAGIKTYAEADAFAQKLLEVYKTVRIVKHVKYVETILGG